MMKLKFFVVVEVVGVVRFGAFIAKAAQVIIPYLWQA